MDPHAHAQQILDQGYTVFERAFDPAWVDDARAKILANYDAILADLGLTKDDIVKTTIFLADIGDFAEVNGIYGDYFADSKPARSTIQAGALPGGFEVEIEAIAAR